MLAQWTVENFKSFFGRSELPLAPLTIICGANSSGKSSLIQSMLLVKQTLQHAPPEKPIALNGPLVRLGGFTDIENREASHSLNGDHQVTFQWVLSPQPSPYSIPSAHGAMASVDASFSIDTKGFRSEQGSLEIQPTLSHSSLAATYIEEEQTYIATVSVKRAGRGRRIQYDSTSIENLNDILKNSVVDIDRESQAQACAGLPDGKIVGCQLQHFMPSRLIVRYDKVKETSADVSLILSGRALGRANNRRRRWASVPFDKDFRALIDEALVKHANLPDARREDVVATLFRNPHGSDLVLGDIVSNMRMLPPPTRRSIERALANAQDQLIAHINSIEKADKTVVPSRSEFPRDVAAEVEHFFRFSLSYLGPLRDDPKPLYPLQALVSQTDVGPKGELTAAVLHLNQNQVIDYVSPDALRLETIVAKSENSTLKNAVVRWLNYLGVAEDLKTSEKGKFGHELRVQIDKNADYEDLTNVGVGVSQLLPIIVMCLLSDEGSTLIIEQPELHLHPAVQARLADFFVCQSMNGRQFIIETHGEHIIERLRRRIASDLEDKIIAGTKIYSFERKKGRTLCHRIALNRFGAIENWPDDFFDQSQKESEQIVMHALARHNKESVNR
ncbi:hypothetical protein VF02_37915 [Nostoc linckia z1]|uniref:AAA family ATPase n=1 Tax=Nostoc linckia TaxID=92942 RepID=UPI000BFF7E87|nr:DUF3696 domain-containing protein [Nostoc linckia]PHJ51351.1 hypothetical protein VF02_37915 [Nostoc linckia z1]